MFHSSQSSLLTCPSEVVLLIARHLPTSDLAHLAQVNRFLYNLSIPLLWANISYKPKKIASPAYQPAQGLSHEDHVAFGQKPHNYVIHDYSLPPHRSSNLIPDTSISASSSLSDISSILSAQDLYEDGKSTPITSPPSPQSPTDFQICNFNIDSLSLAFMYNQVSPLAKASIKTLEISTDYEFGPADCCYAPTDTFEIYERLSFTQFLKRYLLTKETVPNLQCLRITHDNSHHSSFIHKPLATCLPRRQCQFGHSCETERLQEMATIISHFVDLHPVQLSIFSADLSPVQTILNLSQTARQCLRHLSIDILPTTSEHQNLTEILLKLPNLESLSIVTEEFRTFFNPEDHDDDDEEILYQIDKTLFKTAFKCMNNLKTLIIKSTSLIEAFTPDILPPKVTHLELESNYNDIISMSSASHSTHNSLANFNTLWSQMFLDNFSQLTTLNISLWNSELFSSLPQRLFTIPSLPVISGNLRNLNIDGDYLPPGLDALIFASNPYLQIVAIPFLSPQGAHSLVQHCSNTLEELTVFAPKTSFQYGPDFLDYRLLPLLARCHKLASLYIHVGAKCLHGFDVLHLLASAQKNCSTQSPSPLQITIEQTDYELPFYQEVISEDECEDFGGFGMLPLEQIKERLSLYSQIRTTFKPVEGDLSGIQEYLLPIDNDESTHCDLRYKQYYSTLPYARYNCIFNLDITMFLAHNAFILASS